MDENLNNDDLIMLDDIDLPDDDVENEVEEVETPEGKTEEPKEETKEEPKEENEASLLNAIKGKIKYDGNEVEVKSLDDLIANYQKGLNYERLQAKLEKSDNEKSVFIDERAKRANMSAEEYMKKVAEYEEQQAKDKEEHDVQRMIESGVDEVTARRVAHVEAYMQKLQARENELNEREEAKKAEEKKDAEYKKFLEAYPGINVDDIPKEVFENAKDSNLLSVYTAYENKTLKEKLKQMEQNVKNMETSVVKPVGNTTAETSKDPFDIGFDSD